MNNNIILELRQTDSNNIVTNGDYEIELAKEITINEGDIIQMKQSFIDVTNSDQIQIPYDLTISTEHILYFTDWIVDTNTKGNYINYDGTPGEQGFGKSFVPYEKLSSTPLPGYTTYVSCKYEPINPDPGTGSLAFFATYAYVDINDANVVFGKQIPDIRGGDSYTDTFSVIAKTGTFRLAVPSPSQMQSLGVQVIGITSSSTPPTIDNYKPFYFTSSFSIKAGSYDPLDLSLLVSERLSQNQVSELNHTTNLVNNPFLKTSSQFLDGQPYPNAPPAGGTLSYTPIFIATDNLGNLSERMNFLQPAGYYIGSSQVALEYNAQTQKFNWTYLHFPMYDDVAGNQISVSYIPLPNSTKEVMAVAKNGGVAFTNLSAIVTETGQPFDFWVGVLGFDLDSLIIKPNQFYGYFASLQGSFTSYFLVDGVNTTNGFVGIDSAITKKKDLWYKQSSNITAFSSTIDTTVNIVGQKSFSEIQNKFSHFLLSCSLQYTVDYVGSDNYFNIQGIINKYMSYGSYVYSSSDGAIQYQHTGAPITLKSINVRILKSDKTKDIILGPDNTIIFEIIPSNQQMLTKK